MFKVIGCKFLRPRNLCSPPHQKPLIYERFFYVQGHRLQVPMISELVFTTTFKSLPFREVFYSHCHRLQVPTTSELVFTSTFKILLFREAFLFTLSSVASSCDFVTIIYLTVKSNFINFQVLTISELVPPDQKVFPFREFLFTYQLIASSYDKL